MALKSLRFKISLVLALLVLLALPFFEGGVAHLHWTHNYWIGLYANFFIFALVIDIPLFILGIYIGHRTDSALIAVMEDTMERILPIATRLFVEHYKEEQQQGNLPDPLALRKSADEARDIILAAAEEAKQELQSANNRPRRTTTIVRT